MLAVLNVVCPRNLSLKIQRELHTDVLTRNVPNQIKTQEKRTRNLKHLDNIYQIKTFSFQFSNE